MKPVVLKQGEGERLAMGPASLVIKATGDDTAGTFYLGEAEFPPVFRDRLPTSTKSFTTGSS